MADAQVSGWNWSLCPFATFDITPWDASVGWNSEIIRDTCGDEERPDWRCEIKQTTCMRFGRNAGKEGA